MMIFLVNTAPVLLFGLLGLLIGLRIRKTQKLGAWTECPRCNYSLEGLDPKSPCPECGLQNPREAPKERIRPVFKWSGTVFSCFGVALFITGLFADSFLQTHLADLWNSFRSIDSTHGFLRYNVLLIRPSILLALLLSLGIGVGVFLLSKGKHAIHAHLYELLFLLLAHTLLSMVGFFIGFYLAWLDNAYHHDRALFWIFGGTLVAAAPGALIINRFVSRRRVLP